MIRLLKPFLAIGNGFVRRLLRSRFHRFLSGNVVLLEVTGRKSGRVYLVAVNYRSFDNGISVMTYRERQWWRNLGDIDALPVWLKGQRRLMEPEVVTDDLDAIGRGLIDRGWVRRSVAPARAEQSVLIRLRQVDPESGAGDERVGPVEPADSRDTGSSLVQQPPHASTVEDSLLGR